MSTAAGTHAGLALLRLIELELGPCRCTVAVSVAGVCAAGVLYCCPEEGVQGLLACQYCGSLHVWCCRCITAAPVAVHMWWVVTALSLALGSRVWSSHSVSAADAISAAVRH
eukprot:GHUV01040163.1.p2 GENE.GHUV01040163.1~~GHUV01040163.1.p2  ORF type:complete len:112 (-),score=25.76 GHUV01040163.1:601-936(-)